MEFQDEQFSWYIQLGKGETKIKYVDEFFRNSLPNNLLQLLLNEKK